MKKKDKGKKADGKKGRAKGKAEEDNETPTAAKKGKGKRPVGQNFINEENLADLGKRIFLRKVSPVLLL